MTGATGFIGRSLITRMLLHDNYDIYAVVRKISSDFPANVKQLEFNEISPNTNWGKALQGIDCVIHTAARVHVMLDTSNDPLSEFRFVNTLATLNLAQQAAESGVKRFVYLSSIKVNGEASLPEHPFKPDDSFVPTDPYALSKYEAEKGLREISNEADLEVVILRPPLVYGPGVKANFLDMMKWLNKGIPLPFGAIHNKRSIVALDNLVDLIITCITHPAAANQTFLVSDGEDLSTTELLNRVASALGKKSRLLPVNQKLLETCLRIIGKNNLAMRLSSSLQIDMSKTKKLLNWSPPSNINDGLDITAQYFLASKS